MVPRLCLRSALVAMVTLFLYTSPVGGLGLDKLAKNIERIERVELSYSIPPHLRHKRSANQIPDEIHVDVKRGDSRLKIELKKTNVDPHLGEELRVYMIKNHRLKEVLETSQKKKSDSEVDYFTDSSQQSLVAVQRHNRAYDMEGTMLINGREYVITPDSQYLERNGSSRAHKLCQLMKRLSYGHDFIEDDQSNEMDTVPVTPYNSWNGARRTGRRRSWFSRSGKRRRGKRQANIRYIEIAFYCDYACFVKFLNYANDEDESVFDTLRAYYSFVARGIALRFESISREVPSIRIQISVRQLIVLERREASNFTENFRLNATGLDARGSILAFRDFIQAGVSIPRADHWMLFSGYDLGTTTTQDIIGIAFIGRVCTDSSVSVIEEFFTGTTSQIGAHELGHALSARHDSNYAECSDQTFNIMAGISFFPQSGPDASNPWIFSSCSSRVIAQFALGPTGSCLINVPPPITSGRVPAGQIFNADEQCRLSQGPGSYFCRGVQRSRSFDQMCTRLYCYLPNESQSCGSVIAFDRTSCGNGKWCIQGVCREDQAAPRIANGDECPQGDDPSYNCRRDLCLRPEARLIYCCATCFRNGSGVPMPTFETVVPPGIEFSLVTRRELLVSTPSPPRVNQPPPRPQQPTRRPVAPPPQPQQPTRRPVAPPPKQPQPTRRPAPHPPQLPQSPPRLPTAPQQPECRNDWCRCLRVYSFSTCMYRLFFRG